ncbi:MAG TPA: acetone carboxylase subunit gamma [Chloroflexota bacterium]|nr:acetone carboxylase subunit gamma [Chloroflexota bacterium]
MTVNYPREVIEELVDGKLPWRDLKQMMSSFKDPGRFDVYVDVVQERVPWADRILLPLSDNLFIVQTGDGRRIIKSRAGHEFCDYRENWKLHALIFERTTDELVEEIYPRMMGADPKWMTLREYYCPASLTLLEIEAVPPGYPIVHTFQPDLEAFYSEWLGRPLQ